MLVTCIDLENHGNLDVFHGISVCRQGRLLLDLLKLLPQEGGCWSSGGVKCLIESLIEEALAPDAHLKDCRPIVICYDVYVSLPIICYLHLSLFLSAHCINLPLSRPIYRYWLYNVKINNTFLTNSIPAHLFEALHLLKKDVRPVPANAPDFKVIYNL